MRFLLLSRVLALTFALLSVSTVRAATEEFVGPFGSWKNVKSDYGAAGDGKTDDTAALQRGLDDLVKHQSSVVLYVPAGRYRITHTLRTVRKVHTDCMGVAVVGEDPANTVLFWDGDPGGTLLNYDAWYSRISRLTLDGAGKAAALLVYGPAFSTYNQTSDLIFRDAKSGLVFGGPATNGQAENEVLRCRFLRCETGLQTVNWNSLDIWVWYCLFEDCGRGVHNVMGNWHVWESLFRRSRVADLSIQNLMAFSIVNNTSVGSRCFADFDTGHTWGSPTSMTGNRVLDPTGEWAVKLGNAGPYLLTDNAFRLSGSGRAVKMTWGDQTLVANTYTKTDAVEERGRFRRIDERVTDAGRISGEVPSIPDAPPRKERKVFEVPAAADGAAVQRAIDEASALAGTRPVVHLPAGAYRIERTIVVPAGSDVQLVGDGAAETATRLNWSGPPDGVVLRLRGPTRATLRDFSINASNARALLVTHADQSAGRIFADQLNASGPTGAQSQAAGRTAAVRIRGLTHADVLLRALQGSGNSGAWVDVVGPGSGDTTRNQVSIFTGATGSAAGQYDVRQGGQLVVRAVYHERSSDALTGLRLNDRGTLSIDATRFSYATSDSSPTICADGFRGLFTLATCILLPVETKQTCRFEIRGDASHASILALNDQFWVHLPGTTADTVWRDTAQPHAHGGLVGCNINTDNKQAAPKGFDFLANVGDNPDPARSNLGVGPLADRGGVDDATILKHLAPLRAARTWLPGEVPAGATDLAIYRVIASGSGAAVEISANP